MSKKRVLIVDDSPAMRGMLGAVFRRHDDIDVVGSACNPLEARQAIKALNPDVMTLDVEMPHMNGIQFLDKVMRLRPMPVIMVSTLTERGAAAAVDALSIGAFDCVAKPTPDNPDSFDVLPDLVRAASNAPTRQVGNGLERRCLSIQSPTDHPVVLGASTGGVEAIETVFGAFSPTCPPTLVVQHMPPGYTSSLAKRLDKSLLPKVVEAEDGMPLEPGTIYLAPGGDRHMKISSNGRASIALVRGDKVSGHQPSVDVLFRSAREVWKQNCVAILLTGMGEDGAHGLKALRDVGAATFAQDEATSVVYGMPQAALKLGAVDRGTPLHLIAGSVQRACKPLAMANTA